MNPKEFDDALARMRHQVETGAMNRAEVEAMGKELASLPGVRSVVAKAAIRKKINSAVFVCGRLADDLAAANPGHTRDHDPGSCGSPGRGQTAQLMPGWSRET